jgi:hypothetical protein
MASPTGSRLLRLLFVFYFLEAGAFLVLAPWSRFWIHRVVSRSPAALRDLLLSPYLRSFLLGIGLLHIVVAVREIDAWRREAARRNEGDAAAAAPTPPVAR